MDELAHSRGPWKKHKYVKKVGNKYYYRVGNEYAPDIKDRKVIDRYLNVSGLEAQGLISPKDAYNRRVAASIERAREEGYHRRLIKKQIRKRNAENREKDRDKDSETQFEKFKKSTGKVLMSSKKMAKSINKGSKVINKIYNKIHTDAKIREIFSYERFPYLY